MRRIYLLHARPRAVVFLSSDPRAASEFQIDGKKEERTGAGRASALVFRGFCSPLTPALDLLRLKQTSGHCEE